MKFALRLAVLFLAAGGATAALLGCSENVPGFCDIDNPCTDPARPRCDLATRTCMPPDDGGTTDGPAGCTSSAACTDPAAPICGEGSSCRACQSSAECAARDPATPACTSDGACVECASNADCAGVPDKPVCDLATSTCAPCTMDGQCSYFCDGSTGQCVADADILFVDVAGPHCPTPGGTGTGADPFCQIQDALYQLSLSKRYIYVRTGSYGQVFVNNQAFRLRAETGATITSCGGSTAALEAVGASTDAELEGLSVRVPGGACIGVHSGTGARLTVRNANVESMAQYGAACMNATLNLDGVKLTDNSLGGVYVSGCSYDIANSVIAQNGSSTSPCGGVWIANPTGAATFVNNTVASNTAQSGNAAGIRCDQAAQIVNSVVWWNTPFDIAGSPPVITSACIVAYSNTGDATSGQGDISVTPSLVNAPGGDYHYMSGSPGIDVGTPLGAPDHDFDGYPRPYGTAPDMGAFEWHP